jgi:MlaD protein
LRNPSRIAAACAAALLFAAASRAAGPPHYSTELDAGSGLGPGDPVTHAGVKIGAVISVAPSSGGRSEITFEVAPSVADAVREDSIVVLSRLGATPSLELTYTDPMAAPAPDGSFISGASTREQAEMLLAARGPHSLVERYNRVFAHLGPTGSLPTSPAAMQMQNDLLALMAASAMSVAAAGNPGVTAEIDRVRRDEQVVEQELVKEGHLHEAHQLHDEMAALLAVIPNAAAAPPPSSEPSNTLTVPRAGPGA